MVYELWLLVCLVVYLCWYQPATVSMRHPSWQGGLFKFPHRLCCHCNIWWHTPKTCTLTITYYCIIDLPWNKQRKCRNSHFYTFLNLGNTKNEFNTSRPKFFTQSGQFGPLIKNPLSRGWGRYGKTINTVASLGYVFDNRKIRFVITYTIIEIEEIELIVIFLKWPKLPRRPGQFGPFTRNVILTVAGRGIENSFIK